MPDTTSRVGLPFPETTDSADGPDAFSDLANMLDTQVALDDQGTLANRPAAGLRGRYYMVIGDLTTANNGILWRDNGVTWSPIGTVTTDLADNSVTNAKMADASVGADEIIDGTVGTTELAAGAVTAAKVADALKPSTGAGAGTEALRKLGTGASDAAAGNDSRLTDQRVPTDNSVATVKIQALAVTTAKIADSAVATAKLAAGAVTAAKVADALKPSAGAAAGTESLRKLGTGGGDACAGDDARLTNTRTPTDNTVATAKIVDGAVTAAKLGAVRAGSVVAATDGSSELAVAYATPFPTATDTVICTGGDSTVGDLVITEVIGSRTAAGFKVRVFSVGPGLIPATSIRLNYIAVGH